MNPLIVEEQIFHIQGAIHAKVHTTSSIVYQGGCFLVHRANWRCLDTSRKSSSLIVASRSCCHIKNVCERTAKIFFAQCCDPSESKGGSEAEERVSHHSWAGCRAEASEWQIPPIVQHGKMRSEKGKAEETVPPKAGPLKGRKRK